MKYHLGVNGRMDVYIDIVLVIIVVGSSFYMLRKKVNLGLVMLWDSLFVVLLARLPLKEAAKLALDGVISYQTIGLITILLLIMMIENILRTNGIIKNMVDSLKELVGDNRLAAALMPAVIGFLPSPGGARFSCPMVEEIAADNASPEDKAFINYWFRHICMDGFILYPGAILAAELLGVPVLYFFLHLIPLVFVGILVGSLFGLTGMKKETIRKSKPIKENLKGFSLSILPVVALIALYILLLNVTHYALEVSSLIVIVALLIAWKYNLRRIWDVIREAFPGKLVIIIVGVMVFKEILAGAGVLNGLSGWMNSHGIPVGVLFILLPFVTGFTSGITVSFVSITFPILIPLGMDKNIWFGIVAFTAGTIGGMVTPLHLCAVMTADYFKASLSKLLTRIFMAEIIMLSVVTALFIIISTR